MGKNMKVAIRVGLKNEATAGLRAIGTQVAAMAGRGVRAVNGIGTAAGMAMNALGALGRVGVSALQSIGRVGVSALKSVISYAGRVVDRLQGIAKWIAIIGAAATAKLAGDSIRAAMDMEGYLAKLETAYKDVGKAQAALEWAKGFAAKTPFEMSEVVDASVRLKMYGLDAQKWLPLVGDLAGAMGKNVTDAVEAVADAVSGGGLERLKEFAITSQRLKGAGWTGSYQDAEGIATLQRALENIIARDYGGGMAKLAKTGIGAWSNFKDALYQFKVTVGQALMPTFRQMLDYGMKVLEWLKQMQVGEKLGAWISSLAQRVLAFVQTGLPQFVAWLGLAKAEVIAWGSALLTIAQTVLGLFGLKLGQVGGEVGKLAINLSQGLRGVVQQVAQQLVNLIVYLRTNMAVAQQWAKYVLAWGKYAFSWVYSVLPDAIEAIFSFGATVGKVFSVAYGVGKAFVHAFIGQIRTLGVVFGFVGTIIGAAVTSIIKTLEGLFWALSKIPGVGKHLRPVKDALKSAGDMTGAFTSAAAESIPQQAKGLWDNLKAGWATPGQAMNMWDKAGGLEGQGRSIADAMRARQQAQGFGMPAAPTAPTAQFGSWGAGAPQMVFSPTINVDARGASDPTAVQSSAYRGAMAAAEEARRTYRRMQWKTGQAVPEAT